MPVRSRVAVLVALTVLALLSACAAPAPAPARSRSGTPDAGNPPSPSPSATGRPTLDQLTVDADGVHGPDRMHSIKVGAPVPNAGATGLATWDASACVGEGVEAGAPYSGAWSSVFPPGAGFYGDADTPAFLLDSSGTRSGDVDWIVVLGTALGTSEGVHVGSPLKSVTIAYPKPAGVVHLGLSDVYVIAGTVGQLTIEVTTDDGSGYWQADQVGRVFAISSRPVGSEPVGLVATDNVPGCKV